MFYILRRGVIIVRIKVQKGYKMTRYYNVKMAGSLINEENIKKINEELAAIENVKKAEFMKEGVLCVEAETEDFTGVLNRAVNVFRRIDAKSEVKYDFALNEDA